MSFFLNIDMSQVAGLDEKLKSAADKAMKDAGTHLVAATHAHIIEEANQKLHERRQMFLDHFKLKEVEPGVWACVLEQKFRWIDEGLPPGREMIDDLLKSDKAKMAKDGSRYLAVPFKHGPGMGAASHGPAKLDLVATVKAELKKQKIPFGKIEKNPDGTPKLGTIHTVDILKAPLKTAHSPGQGAGALGQPKQGPTGIPLLQGLRIAQKQVNHNGKPGIERSIMTFRLVSSKHQGTGRWVHPGLAPTNLLEEGFKWAQEHWDQVIVPDLIKQFLDGI